MMPPGTRAWAERADWLARRRAALERGTVGPPAERLLDELARVFSAGAWLAAIVLAQAVLDQELEARMAEGGDALALNEARLGRDYVWLRNRRNAIAHFDEEGPGLAALDLGEAALERDARRAVELVVKALAGRPW